MAATAADPDITLEEAIEAAGKRLINWVRDKYL